MGVAIGKKFSAMIRKRLKEDPTLHSELLPFASSIEGKKLVDQLTVTNRNAFPRYWDEVRGMADGSGVSFLELLLLNLRKEVTPFIPAQSEALAATEAVECSDILLCKVPELVLIAHNEDANVSVKGHVYLVHATLRSGLSFLAYTYAGELPTCAFGFNNNGVAFTLNAVPLSAEEVVAGGIGRNFVSRDLLEATDLMDALKRIQNSNLSAGHSYNLMDVNARRVFNVETASKERFTALEVSEAPYFHANMYLRLQVHQVPNESSIHRQSRAAEMPKSSLKEILEVLGDDTDKEFPIYMSGPTLCTLCTVIFNAVSRTMTIFLHNPKTPHSSSTLELSLDI